MVQIWDTTTGDQRAILTDAGFMPKLAIAPDGNWLAGINGRLVRIWDMATGDLRAILSAHTQLRRRRSHPRYLAGRR